MIEEEINRLRRRIQELETRVIPDLERRTETLYSLLLPMPRNSPQYDSMASEYDLLSKELRRRSDELIESRQRINVLEMQRQTRRG